MVCYVVLCGVKMQIASLTISDCQSRIYACSEQAEANFQSQEWSGARYMTVLQIIQDDWEPQIGFQTAPFSDRTQKKGLENKHSLSGVAVQVRYNQSEITMAMVREVMERRVLGLTADPLPDSEVHFRV